MNDLFELSMPWWQFALRGAVCYAGLLLFLRLTGKRTFGEMSPFDIVVLILVGGTLRSAIVGKDASLLGPFISVISILVLDKILGRLATWSPRFNRFLEGEPVLLAQFGRVIPGILAKHDIPAQAFERELRMHDFAHVQDIEEARLEPNGRISVLRRKRSSSDTEQ